MKVTTLGFLSLAWLLLGLFVVTAMDILFHAVHFDQAFQAAGVSIAMFAVGVVSGIVIGRTTK